MEHMENTNISVYELKSFISFLDTVSPNVALLIVNALYFKAAWSVVFEIVPEPKIFTTISGEQVPTKMMERSSFHNFANVFNTSLVPNVQFTVVSIPYAVSDQKRKSYC